MHLSRVVQRVCDVVVLYRADDLAPEADIVEVEVELELAKGELELQLFVDVQSHSVEIYVLESVIKVFNFHLQMFFLLRKFNLNKINIFRL